MEATIAITISASNAFSFSYHHFLFTREIASRRYILPRTPRSQDSVRVFHARQGMDALAVGSQGDGAKVLFIQICSHADRIPNL